MNSTEITITIDPVALVTQECITVTSAMRKHARWAQSSVSAILGGSTISKGTADLNSRSLLDREQQSANRGAKNGVRADEKSRPGSSISVTGPAPHIGSDDEESTLASRWGLRGKKGKSIQDNPLLSAFSKLRRDLSGCRDISMVDAPMLLHPFLQVIRSSSTSASITSLSVISITKFFQYNLITARSPRIGQAMHLLSAAITHCRFEASDTAADEVVLLRILRLMENIMTRPEGRLLPDESICDMMSTGLSMCCQARLTEVLRRSAEMAMVTMCQVVFSRLKGLEIEPLAATPTIRSRSSTTARPERRKSVAPEDLKIAPPMSGSVMGNGSSERPSLEAEEKQSLDSDVARDKLPVEDVKEVAAEEDMEDEITPFALMSIKELLRVLIELLDPHNKTHTDPMRIMALRIIDVALEVAGPSIAAQPNLAPLVENDLCRYLFQLVRTENQYLLNSSLRVAGTLLTTCRKLLKLQQELFLSYLVACLHPRVDIPNEPGVDPALYEGVPQAPKLVKAAPSQSGSGRSTPVPIKDRQKLGLEGGTRKPDAREAMVESIGTLIRMPHFMVQLFVNYDCDVDRQDLCEDMVGLLSRNAFPDAATWSTVNVPPLCLDSLLLFIQSMAERMENSPSKQAQERVEALRAQRTRKRIIKRGAAKFNDDPKAGISFLVRNGIIANPDDPVQLAQFLRSTNHVSKAVLGEFISKKSNQHLLTAFIGLFRFDGKRIDEALRELLGSFRLPGESALIERIVTVFTQQYMSSSVPEGIANQDAAYILTYATIMLNTDLYNPNTKQKRMTCEDFARNLRGVNDNENFPDEYLQGIYNAIKKDEIILPEEHDNKNAFDYAWKELLLKTQDAGQLELCSVSDYDGEMFRATWKPVIATLCYVFMSASEDAVFSRVVTGFEQCAQLAARYEVPQAFDRIVHSLSLITGLATEMPPSTSLNTEVSSGKEKIMVSELAVRLGRDFKAQLATVLLFRVLEGREKAIGDTWMYLVRILRNLFVNSLISIPKSNTGLAELDPIPLQPPSQVIDRDGKLGETGLFSTFTSYLSSYAADDPPEPSEEELENTFSTMDCIRACHCDRFLSNLFALPPHQVQALVLALLSQLPEEPSPVVALKPERPLPVTARVNGHRTGKSGPEYSPGSIFLLELSTVLTLRDEQTMAAVGEGVITILENVIRDASNFHPLATARIVRYSLEMLKHGASHDFIRTPVVLHALSSFDDPVLDSAAPAIMKGLDSCLQQAGPVGNEITASPDFWSILHRLHQHKSQAVGVFDMLTKIATANNAVLITPDNYEAAVKLADDFATAGSIGSIIEQRRDVAIRRGQPKPEPPPADDPHMQVVQRAVKAMNILLSLSSRISPLIARSHLERSEAWAAYWSPVFRSLSAQCVNPCREIRHRALAALQRTLLSPELSSEEQIKGHKEWTAIFHEVLFPLIVRLLKPEVYQLDAFGMSDTRVQAATLLCKIFLRYLDHLDSAGELLAVWTKVLELLDRLMGAGVGTKEGEALEEAVGEGVKNCILVMAGSGFLKTPAEYKNEDVVKDKNSRKAFEGLWNETGRKVERLFPGLMADLFPPPPAASTPAPAPAPAPKEVQQQE